MKKELLDTNFNDNYVDFTYVTEDDEYFIERYSLEFVSKLDVYGNEIEE